RSSAYPMLVGHRPMFLSRKFTLVKPYVISVDNGFASMMQYPAMSPSPGRSRMPAAHDDLVFCHGKVFDGRRFLPPGTCVRVRGGRITGVGPAGPLGSASVVDLQGGTLLPGFIDAHAHPLFAGINLRRCDLHDATTMAAYAELI